MSYLQPDQSDTTERSNLSVVPNVAPLEDLQSEQQPALGELCVPEVCGATGRSERLAVPINAREEALRRARSQQTPTLCIIS